MKKSWLLALSTMMLLSCAAGGQSASSSNPSSPSQGTSETSGDTTPLVPSTPEDSTPVDSNSETSTPTSSTSSSETSAPSSSSSSSTSSLETSTPSSSSSSSSAPTDVPVGDATIDFTYKGAENTAVTSSAALFTASGIGVSSFAPEYVYGLGKETAGIRLSSSKKAGKLTFNLASSVSIRRMIIDAEAYGTDENPTLTVNIGNDAFKQTINERDEYAFDIGLLDTNSFSLSTAAKKRVQVYKITFEIGELVPVYPTSISLNNTEKSIAKGSSFSLSVNYLPANTNQKNVTFASSEPTIATVDSNGRVKGVSNGEATITATAETESGTTSATCKVTVYT
ncbi:MAG: Ig domain-containing protein, partial [Bacilli bacterium]|nr:Ig domain-containing protein [Bacilli bacterium]